MWGAGTRVLREFLVVRTHISPHCGLSLDRERTAALPSREAGWRKRPLEGPRLPRRSGSAPRRHSKRYRGAHGNLTPNTWS